MLYLHVYFKKGEKPIQLEESDKKRTRFLQFSD